MKCVLLTLTMLIVVGNSAFADEEPDHMAKLKELAGSQAIESSPAALDYLRSLTKVQTLAVLRQFGKKAEAEVPVERWPELGLSVAILMCFYPEPLRRSDLTDEEFRNMRHSNKKPLEAGLIPNGLSDEAFDKAVAGIANRNEGTFFRYALAGYLPARQIGPGHLTKAQKERLIKNYMAVVSDRESPTVVRTRCLNIASETLMTEHSVMIWADDAVKAVIRPGGPGKAEEQVKKLRSLLKSGEIKLTPKTTDELASWKRMMEDFRKITMALQEDEGEPESLTNSAKMYTTSYDRDPFVHLQDSASKGPKD